MSRPHVCIFKHDTGECGKIHSSPVVRDPNLRPNNLGSGITVAAELEVDVPGDDR